MIEELVNAMSELDDKISDDNYVPEDAFATARYVIGYPMAISGSNKRMGALKETYVYHGSTRVILRISTQ
jgi:hypothetical protein